MAASFGLFWATSTLLFLSLVPAENLPPGVRCLRRAEDMVLDLRLFPLSHTETCGSSVLYVDDHRRFVLKDFQRFLDQSLRERETCVLKALQQFEWAPRWLCTGEDYMLSSYVGRPACREIIPPDYLEQVGSILSDMHSVGIRHNDLYKFKRSDFLVRENGQASLVDYGWATTNGSLGISCEATNGERLVAKAWRPNNMELDRGFVMPEEPHGVKKRA